MRGFGPYATAVLALATLGVAVMALSPHMLSNCAEQAIGPWAAVALGLTGYAVLGIRAARQRPQTVPLLLVGTALVLLAGDWLMQQTLPALLAMNCQTWTIR